MSVYWSVTVTPGICGTKALFVCLLILHFPNSMECVGRWSDSWMKVMSGQLQGSASGSRLWWLEWMSTSLDAARRVVEGFFDMQRLHFTAVSLEFIAAHVG